MLFLRARKVVLSFVCFKIVSKNCLSWILPPDRRIIHAYRNVCETRANEFQLKVQKKRKFSAFFAYHIFCDVFF